MYIPSILVSLLYPLQLVLWCARPQADASPGSPTGAHGRGPRLYVGGVPDEITEEDIVEHFNKWGQVVDCYFPGALLCIPWQTSSMPHCAENLVLDVVQPSCPVPAMMLPLHRDMT